MNASQKRDDEQTNTLTTFKKNNAGEYLGALQLRSEHLQVLGKFPSLSRLQLVLVRGLRTQSLLCIDRPATDTQTHRYTHR